MPETPTRAGTQTAGRAVTSLRARLLSLILLPLAGLICVNAWVAYGNAVQAANEAYDRSLYLAARTLAEEMRWQDGRIQLDLIQAAACGSPPAA